MKNLFFVILIFFVFFSKISISQKTNLADTLKYAQELNPEKFDETIFINLLSNEINKHRIKFELDSLVYEETLTLSAKDNALYMAENDEETTEEKGKYKTTGDRITKNGGSKFGFELVKKLQIKKSTGYSTYKEVVDEIMFKWTTGKKLEILDDKNLIFLGIGTSFDKANKKIFVSAVFGNYKSFNKGANLKNKLPLSFSTKKYGIKPYDFTNCKKCNSYKNIQELQSNLFVRDSKIWFKTDNIKKLKQLIKNPKDGFAVDIVQKTQYNCENENIIDNNLNNKGILLKPVWSNKLYKKNIYNKTNESREKLEVELGKLPKTLDPNSKYELNLMVVIDKHACKNLTKSYNENASIEYTQAAGLIADTVMITGIDEYIPKPEITELSFKIPFEKNKYDYKQSDIEPFLKALNEPEFIIKNLTISAFSSIEGNEDSNKKLQEKRAESIVNSLKQMQKGTEIKAKITTDDNWDDFKKDISNTEYAHLAEKTKEEAQQYIKNNNLSDKFEYILKNERYAELKMTVTYDISGKKEQAYVVSRFNRAAKECNKDKALLIQKFIFKNVLNGKYDKKAVFTQTIDSTNAECAGLLMNKLWLEKYVNEEDLNEKYCKRISILNQMTPSNQYILHNKYFCEINNWNSNNASDIFQFQKNIESLYSTSLSKETVDNLNLEFQFKIISSFDTLDKPIDIVLRSLQRVKEIVNIDVSSWKDALKLSYLFMEHKDYEFAAKLLEPFIYNKFVFDELLFTYISLCSHSNYRMISNKFYTAMQKASIADKTRFCKLFTDEKISIQVLENSQVKKIYCNKCNKWWKHLFLFI